MDAHLNLFHQPSPSSLSAFGARYERFMALNSPSHGPPSPTPTPPLYIRYFRSPWLSIPMPDMNRPPPPPPPPGLPRFEDLDAMSPRFREDLQRRVEFERGRQERAWQHVVWPPPPPPPPARIVERERERESIRERRRVEEVEMRDSQSVYRNMAIQTDEAAEHRPRRAVRDLSSVWWREPAPAPPPVEDIGYVFPNYCQRYELKNYVVYEREALLGLPPLEPSVPPFDRESDDEEDDVVFEPAVEDNEDGVVVWGEEEIHWEIRVEEQYMEQGMEVGDMSEEELLMLWEERILPVIVPSY